MSLELIIYLVDVLINITTVLTILSFITGFCGAFFGIMRLCEGGWGQKEAARWKIGIAAWLFLATIAVLMPSKQGIYAIAAVMVTRDALDTDVGKQLQLQAQEWVQHKFITTK